MAHSRTTQSVARWSATHPWRALLVWVVFVAGAVAAGSVISTHNTTDADYRLGSSGRADALVDEADLDDVPTENVLITAPRGALDVAAATQTARRIGADMQSVTGVTQALAPVVSADKKAVLLPIQLARDRDGQGGGPDLDVEDLAAVTADAQAAHPDLTIEQVGEASIDDAIYDRVADDLGTAERLSLPVTLAIMLLAFGALIAAGIPVVLAISGVLATIGLYAPLSHLIPAEETVASMVLLIGMAVGVDYSLFYLKREREERTKGRATVEAVEVAAATSGHSIIVSGAAVIVSMAGLYVVQDATFASLATGAILVVAVSVVGSLTVLPALLAKLGRWVDRPRVPLLWRLNRRIGRGGVSRRVLGPVVRRPKTALAVSTAAVVALGVPALGMNLHQADLSTLPQDIPEVQTMQRVQESFPSEGASVSVVVATDSPAAVPAAQEALAALGDAAVASGDLRAPDGARVQVSDDGTVALLSLATPYAEGDERNDAALDLVREELAPQYLDPLDGATWEVGGSVAEGRDASRHQADKLPWVIGFVLLLTLLMMGITFRSVPIAVVTTLLNLASVAAAFGVLTLVFQGSWAEGLLDFESQGTVVDWIPLFMFVVLVGLSMDYHVFVLSRVREGIQRGLPPRVAVESGITETAGVVTSAAAVMVSVFAIFATLSMVEMKQMGVGLAVAVLIDATVVRVVMLPSLLVVLGRWAWWPARPPRPAMTRVEEPPAEAAELAGTTRS
jgi:RND superfamily putative drug exporter